MGVVTRRRPLIERLTIMGLLDSLAGFGADKIAKAALGGTDKGKTFLMLQSLLAQAGGFQNLLALFEKSGLQNELRSWLGEGKNLPIAAEQNLRVFGESNVENAARMAGASKAEGASLLSAHLPDLIGDLMGLAQKSAGAPGAKSGADLLGGLSKSDLAAMAAKLLGK